MLFKLSHAANRPFFIVIIIVLLASPWIVAIDISLSRLHDMLY